MRPKRSATNIWETDNMENNSNMIYIDSLGHTFNTAKEAAKFWGVRESSILKYINGEKPFLFSGKRSKAEVSDVYFAVVERTAINSQADLDAAISLAEIFAWQDQQSCGDYYN